MTRIKICGIQTVEVAKKILQLKPDFIGIYIDAIGGNRTSLEQAKEITALAKQVNIGVFLLAGTSDVREISDQCSFVGNTHIQLLEDISLEEISRLRDLQPTLHIVKVISVQNEEAIKYAELYQNSQAVDSLLLDSRIGGKRGGTGKTHDWNISRAIVNQSHLKVWLAGGLNIKNVEEAIAVVHPYGVDVETGMQNGDGSKNYGIIDGFISLAHRL